MSYIPKKQGLGTYGCVYRPSFPCNKGKIPNTISKVFYDNNSAIKELEESEVIEDINTNNEFTIKPLDHCKINRSVIDENELLKCGPKWDKNIFTNIVYPDGGVDLYTYSSTIIKESQLFKILYNFVFVLKGLKKLDDSGYIHCDIKPQNMVYNEKINKLFLIDFGLMQKKKNLYRQTHIHRHPYLFYPPEFQLYGNIELINKHNIDYYRNINLSGTIQYWNKVSKLVDDNKYKFKYDIDNKRSTETLEGQKLLRPKVFKISDNEFTNKISSIIDIYSIGITMLILIANSKIKHIKNKSLLKNILNWITSVTQQDYKKRSTINEALENYEVIINNFPKEYNNTIKYNGVFVNIKSKSSSIKKKIHIDQNKILNPKTNRYVKKDGKKLMKK